MYFARYRGTPTEEGFDLTASVKKYTTVAFVWRVRGEGFEETHVTKVRCDHAINQGIHLPTAWKTILRCLDFGSLAEKTAKAAREERGEERLLLEARCLMLGQPRA